MTRSIMSNGKLICGYTTKEHLLVDLDNCSLRKALCIAKMIMKDYPDVGDCLVVQCAEDSHHLIFFQFSL